MVKTLTHKPLGLGDFLMGAYGRVRRVLVLFKLKFDRDH